MLEDFCTLQTNFALQKVLPQSLPVLDRNEDEGQEFRSMTRKKNEEVRLYKRLYLVEESVHTRL